MLTQTQLKSIFRRYNFAPLKRFGENYLIDANVKDKILSYAGVSKDDTVLEIGPGFGALTIDLAESGAKVTAVEKDKKAYAILKEIVEDKYANLEIINGDILEFGIKKLKSDKKVKVIGNLPYYVTTPIIEYLIDNRASVESALIVVQKEVAERMLAVPGSKEYGSITCFVQYYTKPEYLYTIGGGSYYPEPDVESGLLKLNFLEKPSVDVANEELLFKIIRGAFNQRRKTIMNSLSRAAVLDLPKEELAGIFSKAGIDPSSRPEDLSLSAFASLTNAISPTLEI